MKKILLALAALSAFAQPETRLSQKNPDTAYQFILGYSGDNTIYICKAASQQPTSPSISVASISNANPAVFTVSGGHGFYVDAMHTPKVTVSGGTGNWTAVNGTWTATLINSTTFSIAVDSTAFGAVAGTIVYTTKAPRTTSPVWSVQAFAYSAANMIWAGWANGTTSATTTCTGSPSQAQ